MKHGYKLYNHSDSIQQQIRLKLALIFEIKKYADFIVINVHLEEFY